MSWNRLTYRGGCPNSDGAKGRFRILSSCANLRGSHRARTEPSPAAVAHDPFIPLPRHLHRLRHRVSAALRRRWWMVLLAAAGLASLHAAIMWIRPPLYAARARLWSAGSFRVPEAAFFEEELVTFLDTQAALLRSSLVVRDALQGLPADTFPNRTPHLQVDVVRKTSVVELKVTGHNPQALTQFLDAAIRRYQAFRREVRSDAISEELIAVGEEFNRLESDLTQAERLCLEFVSTNHLGLAFEERSLEESRLAELRERMRELVSQREWLRMAPPDKLHLYLAGLPSLNRPAHQAVLELMRAQGLDATVGQELLNELRVWEAEYRHLGQTLKPKHPKMMQLEDRIGQGRQLFEATRLENQERIQACLQVLDQRTAAIGNEMREIELRLLAMNRAQGEHEKLEAAVQRQRARHGQVLAMLEKIDVGKELGQGILAVLDAPYTKSAFRYWPFLTVGLAVAGGLLSFLGIALVAAGDRRIRSRIDLEMQFPHPVLGVIPQVAKAAPPLCPQVMSPRQNRPATNPSAAPTHSVSDGRVDLQEPDVPGDAWTEAMRRLRLGLLPSPQQTESGKVRLVASALPGDGRSSVALGLASSLAACGMRTLLIDADLRRPCLAQRLGLADRPGLAEFLENRLNLDCLPTSEVRPGLWLLPAGVPSASPGDLLVGSRWSELLTWARNTFDRVLLDTPPILAVADPSSLPPLVDDVLMVVRARVTTVDSLRRAIFLLKPRSPGGVKLILNGVDPW